jgi:hypothetical protein
MNKITTLAEYDERYPTVSLERWRENVVDAVAMIANKDHQEANWLRDDRPAWENPNEAVNALFDDVIFELFLVDCDFSFNEPQRKAAQLLLNKLHDFLHNTPQSLDSEKVLNDPRWQEVRIAAGNFATKFAS